MPRVSPAANQTRLAPTPNVRQAPVATPEAFGADVFRVIQRAGEVGARVVIESEKERDSLAARTAFVEARRRYDEIDRNIRSEDFLHADSALRRAQEGLTAIGTKAAAELPDRARRAFDAQWLAFTAQAEDSVGRWALAQQKQASDSADAAVVDAYHRQTVENYNVPAIAKANVVLSDITLRQQGRRNGWPDERIEQEQLRANTRMHSQAIEAALVNGDVDAAQAYREELGDSVDPRVRPELTARVQEQVDHKWAGETADELIAKHGPDGRAEAMAAASKVTKDERRASLLSDRLDAAYTDLDRAEKQRERAAYSEAVGAMISAAEEGNAAAVLDIANTAPVSPETRLRLRSVANSLQTEPAPVSPETRPRSGAKSLQQAVPAPLQAELAAYAVMERVDQGAFDSVEAVGAAVLEGGGRLTEARRVMEYFRDGGLAEGVRLSTIQSTYKQLTGEELKQEQGVELQRAVIENLIRMQPGQPVSPADLQREVSAWTARAATSYLGFAGGATALEAQKEGRLQHWLPAVTSDEQADLRQQMISAGVDDSLITKANMALWKKQSMGLPLDALERKRAPWLRAEPEAVSEQNLRDRQRAASLEALKDVLEILKGKDASSP